MLGEAGRAAAVTPSAFIEIDCDGHRGGLPPPPIPSSSPSRPP